MRRARHLAGALTRTGREASYQFQRTILALPPGATGHGSCALAWYRNVPNFGDALSPAVVGAMTGMQPRWVSLGYRGKVIALGSLLQVGLRPTDIVIGAGLIKPVRTKMPPGVTVLALRGPMTAELLGLPTDALTYGDPGLLGAQVLGIARALPDDVEPPVALIPHYLDLASVRSQLAATPRAQVDLIDVGSGPEAVLRQIARSRACVSTSLHGLIVAESLGVPAIWARDADRITGGTFKFNDYYAGTGRPCGAPLNLGDALELARAPVSELPNFRPPVTGLHHAFAELTDLLRRRQTRGAARALQR